MAMVVVGGEMELDEGHGKQRSKRLDAPKDNREHVFACQSETDVELRESLVTGGAEDNDTT